MVKHSVFLTGFPGFIGRRLVREILARKPDTDFTFLVVDSMAGQARRDVEALRTLPGAKKSRMDVVLGDITRSHLGLDDGRWHEALARTTDVFHLAAIYDLHVHRDVATRVNVEGTRNVLSAARRKPPVAGPLLHLLRRGKRDGTVLEDELLPGSRSRTTTSTARVRRLVREAMGQSPQSSGPASPLATEDRRDTEFTGRTSPWC